MAERTKTIDALITELEYECDIEGDAHLSSAEKFTIMNGAIAETWDLICDSGLGEKYIKKANFSTVAGTLEYDLFTIASDFYRVSNLYAVESQDRLRPLRRINPTEILTFTPPTSAVSLRLYYLPYSPVLTTGQSFDGINGWEEHSVLTAATKVKRKREEDLRYVLSRKTELEKRIKSMGKVDFGEPPRISRKRSTRRDPFQLFNQSANAYLVRGDNLEIFNYSGYVV